MKWIPKLSFCITCKNRLYQVKDTLRKNLDDNILHQDFIEFIFVDFGSNDGLHKWMVDNFQSELMSGYLKYYYTEELPYWHASVAKNTAHLCASGDILVNLDCDNYTGVWGGAYVLNMFAQYGNNIVLHQFSGNVGDGSYGRIAVTGKYFRILGGYNESFEPMSYQDIDLIDRLAKTGLQYILRSDSQFNAAIANTKADSIAHTGSSRSYAEMQQTNLHISFQNLSEGRLIANNGRFGIRKNLFDYNGKEFHPEKHHE